MSATSDPFASRQFATTASVIATVYVIFVAVIEKVLGEAAATAASLALTAFAAATFRQYEALHFPPIEPADASLVTVPPVRSPYIVALTFAFIGLQMSAGFLHGIVIT